MEMFLPQIDSSKARVFLLYSRYWHFCKYSQNYKQEKVKSEKNYFYERLIEEYTLNRWQFCSLEWVIENMNELNPMVNPASFIVRSDPAKDYLVHLTDCFNLFSDQ